MKVGVTEDQVVVKVLLKKHIPAFALEQELGRVWCLLRGDRVQGPRPEPFSHPFPLVVGEEESHG